MTVFRIAKWAHVYETAESRKHKALTWVSFPVALDSDGYHDLHDSFEDEGAAAYGAWCAIVLAAARAPTRGVLASSKGKPWSANRITTLTRIDSGLIARVVRWAIDYGWLEPDPTYDSAGDCQGDDQATTRREQGDDWATRPDQTQPNRECASGTLVGSADAEPDVPAKRKAKPPAVPEAETEAIDAWNAAAADVEGWPQARKLREKSARNLAARLREEGGPDEFRAELRRRLAAMAASDHYRGASGWVPSLPWLLEPNGWEKAGSLPPPGAVRKKADEPYLTPTERYLRDQMGGDDAAQILDITPTMRALR